MNISPARLRTYIIIGLISLAVLAGIAFLLSMRFRIISTSPNADNYPSSLGILKVNFNRKLDAQAIQEKFKADNQSVVKFSFESTALIEVQDSTLTIVIGKTPLPGKYSINLANIQALDGGTLETKLNFNVKSIPYSELDSDAKKIYDEEAVVGEELPDSPLVNILPHETNDYKMTYTFPAEHVELPATIIITMKFFKPGDVALPATPQQTQTYLARVRSATNEALAYLQSKNINISDYVMSYTEPQLRNEFPAGYQATPQNISE